MRSEVIWSMVVFAVVTGGCVSTPANSESGTQTVGHERANAGSSMVAAEPDAGAAAAMEPKTLKWEFLAGGEKVPPDATWDAAKGAYVWTCPRDMEAHIEAIGGGGGGGGSTSPQGGSGGGGGTHDLKSVKLHRGARYVIQVGTGGESGGGDRGALRREAKAGGSSIFRSEAGLVYVRGDGGAAGAYNGSPTVPGTRGGDVRHSGTGEVIAAGGEGGVHDRYGNPGKFPGGGGGGSGNWGGPSPIYGGAGADGRVTVHAFN